MRKKFEDCIGDRKLVETGSRDIELAKELLLMADLRERFWDSVKKKSKAFPSLFIEGHYEVIKELCTAILAADGWKSLDHECLFAYLRNKKPELELDFDYLLELKDLRNAIGYRGVQVSYDIWNNNELKLQLTVKALKTYIANRLIAT